MNVQANPSRTERQKQAPYIPCYRIADIPLNPKEEHLLRILNSLGYEIPFDMESQVEIKIPTKAKGKFWNYRLDFLLFTEPRIAVEMDGIYHLARNTTRYDFVREKRIIRYCGFSFVRIPTCCLQKSIPEKYQMEMVKYLIDGAKLNP